VFAVAMPNFDVVSKVQWNEVDNAFNQASKEIAQRFDFKDTETTLEKTEEALTIRSSSEERAKAALAVLQDKLVKRKVSLRFTDPGKPEPTGKGGSRIVVKIKEGIEVEKARAIVQIVKDAKLKVQASIQENQVRVSGKNKDDLQTAIQLLRQQDFGIDLQFVNFRD
jgi:cyclic-di-GMP-binding protein